MLVVSRYQESSTSPSSAASPEDQSKRRNFIARKLSYHGNTIGTLELSHHISRRTPYEVILDHEHFHHVSPAYAKRYQKPNEAEDEYVNRLAQELDDKFKELGPDTVIGCKLLFLILLRERHRF